ncbi:hypothetical protein TNCV_2826881 [Trichonephila clavipes]|nr:hypothetical protein TNCV_2826881 [Trichonephila clavipes]
MEEVHSLASKRKCFLPHTGLREGKRLEKEEVPFISHSEESHHFLFYGIRILPTAEEVAFQVKTVATDTKSIRSLKGRNRKTSKREGRRKTFHLLREALDGIPLVAAALGFSFMEMLKIVRRKGIVNFSGSTCFNFASNVSCVCFLKDTMGIFTDC